MVLVIQDSSFDDALYLDEVLLSIVPTAIAGGGAYAFATVDGLNAVFDSEEFRNYLKHYAFDLVIGVDAITNTAALSRASELMLESNGHLSVRAYHNSQNGLLFHPKFSWFKGKDDRDSLLIGSGNLTLNGLRHNTEAFCWIENAVGQKDDIARVWDKWITQCEKAGRLFSIDDPIIKGLASQNGKRTYGATEIIDQELDANNMLNRSLKEERLNLMDSRRVLITSIPLQRNRGWSQLNMPKKWFIDYFGFDAIDVEMNGQKRVFLREVDEAGEIHKAESRKGVISSISSNYRIELEGGRRLKGDYNRHPIVVFLQEEARSYFYSIFSEDSPFFDGLMQFVMANPQPKNQLPRCETTFALLKRSIPALPILNMGHE